MQDPRLRVVYLLALGVLVCLIRNPAWLFAILLVHIGLWFIVGLRPMMLLQALRRVAFFVLLVALSYAFFGEGKADYSFSLIGLQIPIYLDNALLGLAVSTRIVTLVIASQLLTRTSTPGMLASGFRRLGLPATVAVSLDFVMDSFGGGGGGRKNPPGSGKGKGDGKGKGTGPGNKQGGGKDVKRGVMTTLRQVLRGDISIVTESLGASLERARTYATGQGLSKNEADDLAVIAGLGVVAMGLRMIKILPGVPVAPGHKGIILIPLYLLASQSTHSRSGGLRFGLMLGIVSFLFGMGKFGPFEIIRHAVPGIVTDVLSPFAVGKSRFVTLLVFSIIGILAALSRLAMWIVMALIVQVPPVFFALLIPMLIANILFGALSGIVSVHVASWGRQWFSAPSNRS